MHTLLLRLKAPMQSWGTHSRFVDRDTAREPTKSGVIGIVCSALGRKRNEDITDLAKLRFGVRVDKEGRIKTDYHTAGKGGYKRASGKDEKDDLIVSVRHYLSDADFLVGLESDDKEILETIHKALKAPVWDLFLGRKSFAPSVPVYIPDGLVEKPLLDALRCYPIECERWMKKSDNYDEAEKTIKLRFAVEDADNSIDKAITTRTINDQPVDFERRRFLPRNVSIFFDDVKVKPEDKDVSEQASLESNELESS